MSRNENRENILFRMCALIIILYLWMSHIITRLGFSRVQFFFRLTSCFVIVVYISTLQPCGHSTVMFSFIIIPLFIFDERIVLSRQSRNRITYIIFNQN